MHIFIGSTEISGIAHGLKNGFTSIGIPSETIFSYKHPFEYEKNTKQHWIVDLWQTVGNIRKKTLRKNISRKVLTVAAHFCCGILVLPWALYRFDTFIFLYGQTITNTRIELMLLRALGKKIVFLYVGSDTRPPYIDGPQFPASSVADTTRLASTTKRSKKKLLQQEKYAHICINSPSSAQLHTKPFINWFKIGIPKPTPKETAPSPQKNTTKVRILHSPSNPEIKGSSIILATVEKLMKKGFEIELIKIEGMPNEKVLEELAHCDFVIDQLYSDTPMAAFATEAAHFGKPAVVGGYFADTIQEYLSQEDIPPSLFVHPDKLEKAIELLITDSEFRTLLGAKAKEFVCQNWSQEQIAKRFLQLIEGNTPTDWLLNPATIRYTHGCGMPEPHAKKLIRHLITNHGKASLQLSDKPELEHAFVQFSELDQDNCK